MAVQSLPQANDSNFDQVVFSDRRPVLVEFFAPWCPHCRRMAPVLEELAREYEGRVRVVQANVEAAPDLVVRYQLRGVPTVVVFDEGKEISRLIGEVPKEELMIRLNKALAPAPVRG
jgi:thioredoxin 1